MIGHIPKTRRRASPSPNSGPADIITYRYDGRMVYVPAAHDYDEALAHARDAFPQLNTSCDASLSLSLNSRGHEHEFVTISRLAWPKFVAHMARFQVIDVRTAPVSVPDITITYADADDHACIAEKEPELPPYRGPDVTADDAKALSLRPRSPSISSLHPGRRNWLFQRVHANAP